MIKEIFILIFLYQHSNAGIVDGVSSTLNTQDEDTDEFSNSTEKDQDDVSSGGIILSILEMCIPSKIGINLNIDKLGFQLIKYLFGEDQSRYAIEVKPENEATLLKNMKNKAVSYERIGKTIKEKYIHINHKYKLDLNNLIELHNKWFKNYNK